MLAAMGDDVTVVVPARGYDMGRIFLPEKLAGPHHLIVVPSRGYKHMYWFSFHHKKLLRAIVKASPDVIYLEEEPQSLSALQVAIIASKLDIPVIVFTWENLVRRYTLLQRFWCRWVLRRTIHLIGGSTRAVDVSRQWGYRSGSSVLPQFGVDTRLYNTTQDDSVRQRYGLNDCFVVGWVARLTVAKGIFTLIQALVGFPGKWKLLVVGDGPARTEAQEMARRLGINNQIIWAGIARHIEVPAHLKAMDVMVLPSQPTVDWEEQFGHVLIEAMSCGIPVIGSDSGAIPEVIGDAGLVFQAGDVDDLKEKLITLAENNTLRQCMRKAGRDRVVNTYSDEHIAMKLKQILHSKDWIQHE
jgi:glycosyltransferase involved in cell wall biosynthesis